MTGRPGRVVLAGAGPGDPGLLTVRAHRALADAQVVVFDAAVPAAVLGLASEVAERVRVSRDAGIPPAAVPALLVARAAAGLSVVRLMVGDGGDFGADAEALVAAGIRFEVVPGLGAGGAGAAYAGIPTRHQGLSDLAVDVAGPDVAEVARRAGAGMPGDAVLLPVTGTTLGDAIDGLVRSGWRPTTPAALACEVTTFRQRTVTATLGDLRAAAGSLGPEEPAVLIVGEVTRLRSRLAWLERRPLFGRRVVVTRPRTQAARFAALLEADGAEVVTVPTIRLDPPEDWRPLDEALAGLDRFAWVVLTSANGVAALRERLCHAGLDARALAGARLAAVGPETAQALVAGGLRADVVAGEFRAEGLVESLAPRIEAGTEVLIVRAAEAREVLPRELAALGATVTVAPAYRTVTLKEGADQVVGLLEGRQVDVVTFTSSSTVRGFMGLLAPDDVRRLLASVVLAAIGPITAATIAEYGLEVRVMPREYTTPALAAAIASHFARSEDEGSRPSGAARGGS